MVIAIKDHNTIFKFQNPIAEGDTCKRKLDINKSHNSSINADYATKQHAYIKEYVFRNISYK